MLPATFGATMAAPAGTLFGKILKFFFFIKMPTFLKFTNIFKNHSK